MLGQLRKKIERLGLIPNPTIQLGGGYFWKDRDEATFLMCQATGSRCRGRAIVPGEWVFLPSLIQFIRTLTFEFYVLIFYILEKFKLFLVSYIYLSDWDSETLLLHTFPWVISRRLMPIDLLKVQETQGPHSTAGATQHSRGTSQGRHLQSEAPFISAYLL